MKTNPLLKKTACVLSIALAFSALTPIKILATENASGTTANTSTAVSENALTNISDLRAKRIASRKVELTFTGVSGATHYVIKRQPVGNASSEKIFTVANSPYIDTYVASGQAYTYTVHPALAEQEGNASNVAEIAALPKEEQVDDRDPRIRYGSAYANYSTSNLYMCTEKYIDINGNPNQPEANSTLELDFVGTGIEIYGNKNKNLGKAHIYIDGRELEMADFWKAGNNAEEGVLIKRIENLENGPHTLKIRLSVTHEKRTSEERRKISLDYFKILQENGHKILDDRDPSIRYGSAYGDWLADTLYMCTEKYIDINGNPNQAEANSTLEFDFVGTGIEIYGNKSRQLGKAHVYIDGVEVGEADFWKTANNNNAEKGALITRIDNLADGLHTLKMRVNVTAQKRHTEERRKISLDFFRILREEDYKVLDDRDPRISYGSVFTNWGDDALYKKTQKDGDRQRNHNDEQATATLTFTGTGVEVYGLKTNQLGKATVTIDDQEKEDLNFNIASSNGQKGVLIGRYDGLQDGQHTLKIKVSNQAVGSSRTKISLDKLVILKNPPLMQHPAVPKQVENEELNIELPNHSEWTRLEIALPEVADKVVLNASDVPNESTESTATSGTTNFRRVGSVLKYRLPSERTAGLVRVETFNQEQSLGTEVSYVSEAVVPPVDNSLREAKEQASQAIEQAHNEKLQALEAISPALTTEEKAERTQSLTQAKERALQSVSEAENVEAVENAKNAGVTEIGRTSTEASEKKTQAKQAIDQEALTKLAEINTSSLTTEERQAKTALLEEAKRQAKANIDQAVNNQGVEDAKTQGVQAVQSVNVGESQAKTDAKAEIQRVYNEKLTAIQQSNLFSAEKEEKRQALEQAKTEADRNIQQAQTNDEVNNAKTQGIQAIQAVTVGESQAKEEARQAIEQAYNEKRQAIDQSSLTNEEKESKRQELEPLKTTAINNVNNAESNEAVTNAKNQGVQAIQDVTVGESQAKTDARQAVEEAYNNKLQALDQITPALTTEEKAERVRQLEEAKNTATTAIAQADTQANVTTAKEQGIANIGNVSVAESAKKAEARQAVEQASATKLEAINTSSLTNEEKAEKRQALNTAKEQAVQAVDRAENNEAVEQAKTQGVQAIQDVTVGESQAKAAARQAVEQAYTAKVQALDQITPALTTEEKAERVRQLGEAKGQAVQNIAQATSTADIDREKTAGLEALNNVSTQEDPAKVNARNAIETAYNAKLQALEQVRPSFTTEEKNGKVTLLDSLKNTALEEINQAVERNAVEEAKTRNENLLQNFDVGNSVKKAAAKATVDHAYTTKLEEIENASLTTEDRQSKVALLEESKRQTHTNIDQAANNQAVEDAKTQGVQAIQDIVVNESQAKTEAKAELQRAYEAKLSEITQSSLTNEEKAEKRQELEPLKTNAITAINQAESNEAVTNAKTQGVQNIENLNVGESQVKTAAKAEVQRAYEAKLSEINASTMTSEEKETARQALNTAKTEAENAVDTATSNATVDSAKAQHVQNIQNVNGTESAKKAEARQAVEQAYNEKLAEIERSSLTNEEKAEKRQAVATAKEQALQSVNNAENNEAVTTAKNQGVQAIQAVTVGESQTKADARQAVEQASTTKLEAINTSSLTNEEKAEKRQAVAAAKAQALQSVNNADSNEAVTTAKNQGVQNIEAVTVGDSQAKEAARQAVEQAYNEKLQALNTISPALTTEEKAERVRQLNEAKNNATTAIAQADTQGNVTTAKEQGIANIGNVSVAESAKKAEARQAVEQASATKLEAINTSSLTNEEKAEKRQALNTAKEQAVQAVDRAENNEAVTNAKNQGVQNIEAVTVGDSQAKEAARQAVEQASATKLEAINTSFLTNEEKAEKRQAVATAKEQALQSVNNADSNEAVEQAKTQGVQAIQNVVVGESQAKTEARQAVEQAYNEKLQALNTISPALTTEEKAERVRQLNEAKNNATTAIAQADTQGNVTTAKEQGITNIGNVSVAESAKKVEARQAIEQVSATKLSEIDQSSLTNEEKEAKRQALNTAKAQALQSVNNAESNEAVTTAKTQGVQAIQAVTVGGSQAKAEARQALQSAYSLKLQAINEITPALTTEEKAERVRQLDEAKTTATTAIDQSLNNEAVTNAKTQGLTAINNVATTESAEKAEARALVEETYNSKLEEINNANLTESEKQEKRSALGNVKEQALQRVNNATDRAGVGNAAETGVQAIQTFEVGSRPTENQPSTEGGTTGTPSDNNGGTTDNNGGTPSDNSGTGNNAGTGEQPTPPENQEANALQEAKTEAKALITASYEEKLAQINDSSLSETEKNSKREALETAKATAISAIDNASTNETVVAAAEAGVVNIQAITVPARPTENPPSTEGGTSGTPSDNNSGTGTPSTEGGSTGTGTPSNPSEQPSTPTDTTPVAPTETQENTVFVVREANGTEKGMVRSANPMPNHKLHIDLSNVSASENRDVYDIYFKENNVRKTNVQGNFEVRLRRRAGAEVSKVVHLDNNGTVVETFAYRTEGDFVVFNTTHFSLYAIEYASAKPSITIPGIVYKAWNWVSTGKTEPVKDQVPNTSASSAFAGLCVLVGAGLVAMKKRK